MSLFETPEPQRLFQVGSRLADGKTVLWHVPAHTHEDAAAQFHHAIKAELTPLVTLVCISGGKS